MIINGPQQHANYIQVGLLATQILEQLRLAVAPGVTSLEIDQMAFELCRQAHAKPNFVGVGSPHNLYKHATCISVNDTVLHGIPTTKPFKVGDIVKLDFGLEYLGLNADHCCTVVVGEFSSRADERLVKVAQEAVQLAARQAVAGKRTGDIGHILYKHVKQQGLEVVREYVGHGIGRTLHDEPSVPAFGQPHTGALLKAGMVLCIEAQVLAGKPEIYQLSDGWTIKTRDGGKSAMFEYMVIVGESEPEFLTPTLGWPVVAKG